MTIIIDSNIPMYLVGAEHPLKAEAKRLLKDLIVREERLVTDVEVLQEVLHRYVAIGRPEGIQPAFDVVLGVADEVFALDLQDVEEAKQVILGGYGISARDAIHVAVMRRREISRILSFDTGFDRVPGIERVG